MMLNTFPTMSNVSIHLIISRSRCQDVGIVVEASGNVMLWLIGAWVVTNYSLLPGRNKSTTSTFLVDSNLLVTVDLEYGAMRLQGNVTAATMTAVSTMSSRALSPRERARMEVPKVSCGSAWLVCTATARSAVIPTREPRQKARVRKASNIMVVCCW